MYILICSKCIGKYSYIYPVSKGVYLSFDSETRTYEGLEMFYLPKWMPSIDKKADELIEELLRKGILEYVN